MNPLIEALRGLAALLVLVHHYSYIVDGLPATAWIHALHNGVDLFFVITGYLFAPYLLGEVRQSVAAFAIRRFFRLYPLYVLSLSVAVLKDWGERGGLASAAVLHLLFAQATPMFGLEQVGYFSLIYWTLPVEVSFYLLVAALMAVSIGARTGMDPAQRRRRRVLAFGALALVSWLIVHRSGLGHTSEAWVIWQAQLPALLPQFWLGLLAYHLRPSFEAGRRSRIGALVTGAVLLLILCAVYPGLADSALTARPFGVFNLLSAVAYAAILAAVVAMPLRIGPGARRIAIAAGAASYAVYLFHEWTLKTVLRLAPDFTPMAQVTLALVAVLVVAALVHTLVEAPLRAYGRRLAARFDR